ncbi:MAG: peptidyl-prolyl cis-trans isomerase [Puniceicoccales bacterium]|nr:peptidyl-prolyl cis-trans isomerase [Puniceicoccales bacterium]
MSFLKKFLRGVAVAIIFSFPEIPNANAGGEEPAAREIQAPIGQGSRDFSMPVYANDIAAIVNNEIITMTRLMREIAPLIPRIRAESRSQEEFQRKMRQYQEMVLNAFIERVLIVSDFKSKGGKIPDTYEKKEYEAFIRSRFNDDRVAFAKHLRESGESVREFKRDISEHAIVSFVLMGELRAKNEISPAKIREYYDEHIHDFIVDRQIYVRKITLLKSNYGEDELQAKLAELASAIRSGDDIQFLVKKFNDLPMTQIGWISADQMIPEFANALRGLQVGEFTAPITLDSKVYVLYAADEKPAKKFTLDEVRDDIEKILAAKYQAEAKDKYMKKLKEKAYIKVFL